MTINQITSKILVRPFVPADRSFMLSLTPRLVIGIPPWRDPDKMLSTVERWLFNSIDRSESETKIFVAEDENKKRLGFKLL
jgi:hypothetical protein